MYKISKLISLCFVLSTVLFASPSFARNWSCTATVFVEGPGNYHTTIRSFRMSDNNTGVNRRHIKCQAEIKRRFIDNGTIWRSFNIPANVQSTMCGQSKRLRVEYGVVGRNKSFNFSSNSTPSCRCTNSCPSGYTARGSACERRLCGTSLSNRTHLTRGEGLLVRNGAVYESVRSRQGNCRFR